MKVMVKLLKHTKLIISAHFSGIIFYTLFLFLCSNSASSQKVDKLFASDDVIDIELKSDFTALELDRTSGKQDRDGELIYSSPEGKAVKLTVKVTVRGNFRRNPENCNFPPLLINFKKSEVKNTLFDNQDKLDLTTPCQNQNDLFEEYLVYKMYNHVTDFSSKVRLVKIKYYDTSSRRQLFEKYSFFIEEKEHVAQRNDARIIDKFITPYDLDEQIVKKISVFQYAIGNKDWYYTTRHNIVLMQANDTNETLFAMPYDFDFSGFVDASYTKPKGVPDTHLEKKRQYKGICYSIDEFNQIFDYFISLRPAFEDVINNMNYLPWYLRKRNIHYLREFYSIIRSRKLVQEEFLDVCNTRKDYNILE